MFGILLKFLAFKGWTVLQLWRVRWRITSSITCNWKRSVDAFQFVRWSDLVFPLCYLENYEPGIHYGHTLLVSSWQAPRTVLYILTRLEANGASPPATQENTKASGLGTTPVHTCMSSVKSLSWADKNRLPSCLLIVNTEEVLTVLRQAVTEGSRDRINNQNIYPDGTSSLRCYIKAHCMDRLHTWAVPHPPCSDTKGLGSV